MDSTNNRSAEALLAENAELRQQLAEAMAQLDAAHSRHAELERNLRFSKLDKLPEQVRKDAADRVRAGLPEELAIECALRQHEHDARKPQAESTQKPTPSNPASKPAKA